MSTSNLEVLVQRDCLGGERVVEIRLPTPVDLEALDRVEGVTKREILSNLPRPFFRLDVKGRFLLSGIIGDPKVRFTVRLALRDTAVEVALETAARMSA